MITVIVTYKVKESYISTNKENIAAFLKDFSSLDTTRFRYTIYQHKDKSSFSHVSCYSDQRTQKELLNIPSFLFFQQQRDQHLTAEPIIEILETIGSAGDKL